jgi:hypothetical protein
MPKSLGIACGLALVAAGIGVPGPVDASLAVSAAVGGTPTTGSIEENFDSLLPGTTAATIFPSGVTISFDGNAQAISGSVAGLYAAPFLSGSNGLGFGPNGSNQSTGLDGSTYVYAGYAGSVTLQFAAPETYLGLLWGSVDSFNTLSFYNGSTLVGTLSGGDVIADPNGDQGPSGTVYVNVNATGDSAFNRVVATSGGNAFEFDDIAFYQTISTFALDPIPEPMSLSLLGIGLLGLGIIGRRCIV